MNTLKRFCQFRLMWFVLAVNWYGVVRQGVFRLLNAIVRTRDTSGCSGDATDMARRYNGHKPEYG